MISTLHRGKVPFIAVVALAGLVAACSGGGGAGGSAASGKGGALTVGWSSPPDTLNPATTGARSVGPLTAAMFETLVYLTPDLKPTPGLATKWSESSDGKSYTFDLRKGVTFHDGTPFNAAAVVENFRYITDKNTQSTIAIGLLGTCTQAKAVSDLQVKVVCSAPYAPLLVQLGEPYLGIQSPTAINKYGKDLGQHPVGTGPFEFVSYTPNQSLVLKKNATYNWAPKAVGQQGPAKLDSLQFDFIPNNQSRVGALQSNQAQVIQATPGVFYKQFANKYTLEPNPISGMGIFAPINAGQWPTNDPAVRKAITYALDRSALVNAAGAGVFPPNETPVSKGMLGYDASLQGQQPHDPAKAKAALEAGGWAQQGDGWYKDGKKLSVKITAISTSSTYPAIAQAMQANLAEVGMAASVVPLGASAWTDANVKGDFNMTPLTYVAADPDALSFWFSPNSFFNWSHYSSGSLTSLLTQGRTETDEAKRQAIYVKAQQLILDASVLYPIYENQDLLAASKKVTGLSYSGGGFESFYKVSVSS